MKSFLLCLMLSVSAALGADYDWTYFWKGTNKLNGATNSVAADTTNTYAMKMDLAKAIDGKYDLEVSFKCPGTNVLSSTLLFYRSLDGTTVQTTPTMSLTVPANGTNQVVFGTNYVRDGYRYLHFDAIINPNTNEVTAKLTNLAVRVGFMRD